MANLRIRPRVLLRGLALLASLAALGWTAQWMLNAHLLSEQWIDAEVAVDLVEQPSLRVGRRQGHAGGAAILVHA